MRVLPKAVTRPRARVLCAGALATLAAGMGWAQAAPAAPAQPGVVAAPASASPLAIVPINSNDPNGAATVTGALEVADGKAMIGAGGSITSGSRTTQVVLPRRGVLRVCAATTVKLAADSSVPAGDKPGGDPPGLLMAMDHGAVEMSFATTAAAGSNSDILLTPDFRILVAGPGSSELKVRLGAGGDTCIDNSGASAPYVVVTSLFDAGLYRVQPGQRVMFQHGSLNEVVDAEKEPCGCPAAPSQAGNEFPLAQSEGLAPTQPVTPAPHEPASSQGSNVAPLVYSGTAQAAPVATLPAAPATSTGTASGEVQAVPTAKVKQAGLFRRIGRLFRRIFGAE